MSTQPGFLEKYANPTFFMKFSGKIVPWLTVITSTLLAVGVYLALTVPDDYQQMGTVKIMFVHVPMSTLAMGAYMMIAISSIGSLVWRHPLADVSAKVMVPIGMAFCFLSLVTGSIWGRPMWGTYWVWDARLTSMLILLFLYMGLFAIWQAFEEPSKAGRAAAILALVGAINIPIIKYSVIWWNTLHQSASILDAAKIAKPSLDKSYLPAFFTMLIAFSLLLVLLHMKAMRAEILRRRVQARRLRQVEQANVPTTSQMVTN